MNIYLVGNCQLEVASNILQALCPDSSIQYISTNAFLSNDSIDTTFKSKLTKHDYLFYSPTIRLREIFSDILNINSFVFPTIVNSSEMQDCVYVGHNREIHSGVGIYHSFIVLCSYIFGLTQHQAMSMFNARMYHKLGYFQILRAGADQFRNIMVQFGLNDDSINRLTSSNILMHTVNHPRLIVIETAVKSLLQKMKIPYRNIDVSSFMSDPLLECPSFPTLIDAESGKATDKEALFFKKGGKSFSPKVVNLREFISLSYQVYHNYDSDALTTDRFNNDRIEHFKQIFTEEVAHLNRIERSQNPYKVLPNHCFWRRSISRTPPQEVDPVVEGSIKILNEDKVATAGSCFAQHISNRLQSKGFNFLVTESTPIGMTGNSSARGCYGQFSARYGNVYTTRQLIQLFDRAFGHFNPKLDCWEREDGVFVDPFRPQIEPDGFVSEESLRNERQKHLQAVKIMFEELDVFVFTLGLTECWEYIEDGSILPLAPGVAGGEMNSEIYAFRNFSKQEVRKDLELFLTKLKSVNPKAKVILTVSPVPLMATYENRHVLVSTTVSKSVLRVVADEVSVAHEHVHYFPSYEIITGSFNRGSYFKEDLREVDENGVDHVMRLFMKHYTLNTEPNHSLSDSHNLMSENSESINPSAAEILQEMESVSEIFCDEEAIDNQS